MKFLNAFATAGAVVGSGVGKGGDPRWVVSQHDHDEPIVDKGLRRIGGDAPAVDGNLHLFLIS